MKQLQYQEGILKNIKMKRSDTIFFPYSDASGYTPALETIVQV